MTSEIIYKGSLHTDAKHIKSGTIIQTDAPTDNKGKGACFSPSDLLAAALGSCIITTIAIKTDTWGIDLDGARIEVLKVMGTEPRRVSELNVAIYFPKSLNVDEKQKKILENIAKTCPVAQSLHSELKQNVQLNW